MEENVKKKTFISKILIIYVAIQWVLLGGLSIVHKLAYKSLGYGLFKYWRILVVVPVVLSIPFLILSIVGMVKEKRVVAYILCMVLSFIAWFLCFAYMASFA